MKTFFHRKTMIKHKIPNVTSFLFLILKPNRLIWQILRMNWKIAQCQITRFTMLMVQTIFLRLILVSDYIYSKHFKQLQLQFTITFRLQARLKNSGKKEIEILNIAFSTPNLHLVANIRKKKISNFKSQFFITYHKNANQLSWLCWVHNFLLKNENFLPFLTKH